MQDYDFKWVFNWENNPENWKISGTEIPFTKEEIRSFTRVEQNLINNKQFRYIICLTQSEKPIGCIDLFDYNKINQQAGVGVLIAEENYRNKGLASESLNVLIQVVKQKHCLKKLFCNISPQNIKSIRLFEHCGFQFIEERELFNQRVNYYELKL